MEITGELTQKVNLKNGSKKWKKYTFQVTKQGTLVKYKDKKKVGSLNLQKCKLVDFSDYNCIVIIIPEAKEPLVLQTQEIQDRKKWIEVIENFTEKDIVDRKTRFVKKDEQLKKYFEGKEKELIDQYEKNEQMILKVDELSKKVAEKRKEIQLKEDRLYFLRKGNDYNQLLKILNNDESYSKFLDFCVSLKCEENCLFWKEAECYKTHFEFENETRMRKEAKRIFDKFLSRNSRNALNIDSHIIDDLEIRLDSGDPNLFVKLQREIVYLMKGNSFQLFIDSQVGRAILNSCE